MGRKKKNSDALRGRATPNGKISSGTESTAEEIFPMIGVGMFDLLRDIYDKKQISVDKSLQAFENFLFYYLGKHPVNKKTISQIEDYLIDAIEQSQKQQYGVMLANILLILALIEPDGTELENLKKEYRKGQRKGGLHSHWSRHSKTISKHLKLYHERKYRNKSEVILAIEQETGATRLPQGTFDSWWKKYKAGRPLFLSESITQFE